MCFQPGEGPSRGLLGAFSVIEQLHRLIDLRHYLRVSHTICVFVAVASHYFLLVSFFCMNVISYDAARTFLAAQLPPANTRRRFKLYSYYSWGVPALIVIAANIVDRQVDNIFLAR